MKIYTKQELVDRIRVYMTFDEWRTQAEKILNIDDPPVALIDLDWFYRSDLTNLIIANDMEFSQEECTLDWIDTFEAYEIFDNLINQAQKEHHDAEWVYDSLLQEWYNMLKDAEEQAECDE